MSPKVKFKWTYVEQKAFDYIKRSVAHKTLLAYPHFNKRFGIHTYTIYNQFVSGIGQEGKPIYFYSLKPTGPQT